MSTVAVHGGRVQRGSSSSRGYTTMVIEVYMLRREAAEMANQRWGSYQPNDRMTHLIFQTRSSDVMFTAEHYLPALHRNSYLIHRISYNQGFFNFDAVIESFRDFRHSHPGADVLCVCFEATAHRIQRAFTALTIEEIPPTRTGRGTSRRG